MKYRCGKLFYQKQYHNQCSFKHCLTLIWPAFLRIVNQPLVCFGWRLCLRRLQKALPLSRNWSWWSMMCGGQGEHLNSLESSTGHISHYLDQHFKFTLWLHCRQLFKKVWPMGVTGQVTEIWLNNRNIDAEGWGDKLCCHCEHIKIPRWKYSKSILMVPNFFPKYHPPGMWLVWKRIFYYFR